MTDKVYYPIVGYFDSDEPLVVWVLDRETNQKNPLPFAGGEALHSPSGYAWGYHGSGPAELARAILADHLGHVPVPALYQKFKDDFIARFDQNSVDWRVETREINNWLVDCIGPRGGDVL